MSKSLKLLFKTIIGIFIVYIFISVIYSKSFDKNHYDKQGLIANYEQRKVEINEVKVFVDSITSNSTYFKIKFYNDNSMLIEVKNDGVVKSNWCMDHDLKKMYFDSKIRDSLLTVIDWSINDLELLKQKLDKANCFSVASGNPLTIGWGGDITGIYLYNIFDHDLNDSLVSKYNDGCRYIFYKKNVVLEYNATMLGPQCFQ